MRLLGRIKDSFDQQLVTSTTTEEPESREEGSTTLANEHIISTTDGTAIDDDDNEETDTETETENSNEGNFIHLRKCQMLDDWGPIGLNCTEEDIVTERVQVVGFLANWLHTYLYIRSEFQLPPACDLPPSSCRSQLLLFHPSSLAGMSFGSFS